MRENWTTRVIAAGIPLHGDTSVKGVTPLEDDELKTVFSQLAKRSPTLRKLALHIKNEGKRHGGQITKDRAKGVLQKGASDFMIPAGPQPLIIELKCENYRQSHIEPEQIAYLQLAKEHGADVWVCLGWRSALAVIEAWAVRHGYEW